MKILLVEDDPDIADGLIRALKREGYTPDHASTGIEGEDMAIINSYAVILLDLMLPGKDGRDVCRSLRSAGIRTPIIMVTARDEVSDRVGGLDAGADDYLVKPFSIDELLARVRAVLRRESAVKTSVHHYGPLTLDTLSKSVSVNGQTVHLTSREYELLEALSRNRGRVLTRDAILERVWNTDDALPNTVNFHMSSLRKKIDPDQKIIRTVHGIGYVLDVPDL